MGLPRSALPESESGAGDLGGGFGLDLLVFAVIDPLQELPHTIEHQWSTQELQAIIDFRYFEICKTNGMLGLIITEPSVRWGWRQQSNIFGYHILRD